MSIQIHLAISHVAVIGAISAFVVLITAHRTRIEVIHKLGYGFVLASASAAGVSYFTGPPAYDHLMKVDPSLVRSFVESHAVMGKASFVLLMLTGVICLSAVMQYFQGEMPTPAHRRAVLAALLASVLVIAWTAHLGGLISHPELR